MRLTDEPKTLQEMKPDTSWSPEVQAVMRKALSRRKEDRYDRASKFGQELWTAVDKMPNKPAAEMGTMVMGAATAVISAPPPTRIDASPAVAPPASVAPQAYAPPPVAAAPAKSNMPILAGAGAAVAVIAVVAFMMLKPAAAGAPVAALPGAVVPNATPVTAPAGGTAQNSPAVSNTGGKPSAPVSTPVQKAGGGGTVVSYARDLESLDTSVQDRNSALGVIGKVGEMRSKVTLASDKAYLTLIEGKANIMSGSAERACAVFKTIKASDLDAEQQKELKDGISSTCQ